jgi:integrase
MLTTSDQLIWTAVIRAHIGAIGQQEIATFGNAQMRDFVAHLSEKKLAPKTITEVSNAVRQIISSVVDAEGDEVFPRKWNSEFIDAPIVEKQNTPTVTSAEIEQAIAKASEVDAALYVLLAASGLRIGEALALRIGPSETSSCFYNNVVIIRTSVWRRREQDPKTIAAHRTVELAGPAATYLAEFANGRNGFAFGNGTAPSESAFRDRLSDIGIQGFHAFRRWRTTWLRKNRVQEDLIRWWLGHSAGSITDGYSKLSEDIDYRREVAEKVGIGFNL